MSQANANDGSLSLKQWLDSPKMQQFREMVCAEELRQAAEDQAWWDSLTMDERAQAFRQVVNLMYKAEVIDKGSYRHAIYDVFNVDYADGLAHYMTLHNLIYKGMEDN